MNASGADMEVKVLKVKTWNAEAARVETEDTGGREMTQRPHVVRAMVVFKD